jgi:hypothetical protein
VTQLRSTSELRQTPAWTSTMLTKRPHRAHSFPRKREPTPPFAQTDQ